MKLFPSKENLEVTTDKVSLQRPKFHVGDLVYVVGTDGLEGPFTVASIPATDACTLCDEDGNPAKGGNMIQMANLADA